MTDRFLNYGAMYVGRITRVVGTVYSVEIKRLAPGKEYRTAMVMEGPWSVPAVQTGPASSTGSGGLSLGSAGGHSHAVTTTDTITVTNPTHTHTATTTVTPSSGTATATTSVAAASQGTTATGTGTGSSDTAASHTHALGYGTGGDSGLTHSHPMGRPLATGDTVLVTFLEGKRNDLVIMGRIHQ